ncbi:PEGA domain-containing protein [Asticcacaulis sp. 201]|uniref:PEGA domain-containing protein n=1 Tax=Asticcacaulis sp. 201 TaxID=3028787 RepID=UPI0029170AA7|nr:PEGA domain-containing protein [Asticcacaulis sp. 201]MDV6332678.1 PEGA domain-containing protein [Asticcacaulis sp. 201]
MNKLLLAAALAAVAVSTSGCATITRGTHDAFEVQTDPVGATVKTSNGFSCDSTPCSMRMERKSEFDVAISKPGYKTWNGHVTHKTASGGGAAMAGNVLVGGIIGAVVDGNNGATQDLVPNPLIVKLEAEGAPAKSSADSSSAAAAASN